MLRGGSETRAAYDYSRGPARVASSAFMTFLLWCLSVEAMSDALENLTRKELVAALRSERARNSDLEIRLQ